MSFLTRTLPRSLAASQRMAVQSRAFTVSSARMLKEDDRHNDDQGAANEHHKQDQLKKQKEGKGHWKPELASNSEEAIAADRNNKDESPEELQKRTQHHAAEKHK
ncbi:hypothetical protein GLAREA_01678 [Glarea lozoyensis ATCC 20868]|uniref:Mitochondrial carrier n=1 Tax=Glarea lozoyensis (strain ATCC 20868 / MF5171) TaxID=1116229 RepID=S3D176_GLAL2|nr:uncharacterized protein GLAREA_01678 [Glarea lozoyensis ATCC 20868]EPE25766.1 hypothetical protein GLAREA_01678 [Glarea lozoyensis ATCC 20868]